MHTLTTMFHTKHIRSLGRTAALLCAAAFSLSLTGPLRAQSPIGDPNRSPAAPTPYSTPVFHAGGEFTPPLFIAPPPVPFPDPLYGQLQGTPTGLVPGTGVNAGAYVSTEIPSFLLGNYLPGFPPAGPTVYFPNHFRDGTAFSWSAPLTFITAGAVAPTASPTGASPLINVESTPTAVNVAEFPFIQNVKYFGTTGGSISAVDAIQRSGALLTAPDHLIRQLVYFGRAENIVTTTTTGTGAGAVTTTTNTPVGAVYCVDGFTGSVVWRFQVPSIVDPASGATLRDPSVFSSPAVAYLNVITSPAIGAVPATYANKAVVVVTANDGFVYCLDATGNGDGTSNVSATTGGNADGNGGTPIYGAQPVYPATVSTTAGPHVGTTSVYWIYRPDPAVPNPSTPSSINFDPQTVLPVPGPFGLASPNIYVERGVSTVPDVTTGKLASNAVIYVGNTRDCVYALDGLGVANNRTAAAGPPAVLKPAYNASLLPSVTGVSDLVPTVNPRWWFTPDNASNNGLSFESTPAVSPTPPAAVVVTSSLNPATGGTGVTFTATVTDGTGDGVVPTGSVTFSIDGVAQGAAVPLVAGVATSAPIQFTTAGSHRVTANYNGDARFFAARNTPAFDEEIESGSAATTNTLITSSLNPDTPPTAVTFTATVVDGTGAPVTNGTVTFTVNGATQLPPVTVAGGVATLTFTFTTPGAIPVGAVYTPVATYTASTTLFEEYVYGATRPVVYIGSSQELGVGSNAGRLYAIDGFNGPAFAGRLYGGPGHALDQRAAWSFPNAYANGGAGVPTPGNNTALPSRPALGNVTGSPVVFTNTDVVVSAGTGVYGAVGYIPTQYQTRVYFAANSGLEVPYTPVTNPATPPKTRPNPRPATDTTGRIWAVNTDGTTAFTGTGAAATVWSFPEANNPNIAANDNTPEPSPPIGSFLHSTPAIGFVQFPATIQYGGATNYNHVDAINTGVAPATDVKSKSVPMLYIGTNGVADLGLYALDINGGNDAERGVYRLESPTGSTFESSPVLVTNSSTLASGVSSGGNGGAVYATSGNSLLQVTATPISNVNTAQTFAFVGVDATFSGGGPISGPAVAAASTTDLTTAANLTLIGYTRNVTDFVYFGDGTLGFCRGITPIDTNYGGAVPPTSYAAPIDTNPTKQYSNKFFLQAYLFDGTNAHKANDPDMRNALGLNTQITGFEWGGFSYIRIGNVVPPCPAADIASPTDNEVVADPTDPTLFYGNGQAVSFSIGNASVSVPQTAPTTAALTGAYPEALFTHRSDPPKAGATAAAPGTDPSTQLVTPTGATGAGLGWIAAYSYPIGADQTRIGDTPGAFRRVRQANQTATIYTKTATGYATTGQTINLNTQTSTGSQYVATDAAGAKTIKQTPPTEQPTFGILNPLALRGKGVPLVGGGVQPVIDVADTKGAGPFGPVSASPVPKTDYAAFTNGSNYIPSLPKSGYDVTTEDPTSVTKFVTDQAVFSQVPISIATSVGDIVDGTTGDNLVDAATQAYGLEVQNRSLVGTQLPNLFPQIPVAMQSVIAHWNDNTPSGTYPVGPPQNELGGPAATINPLPWEDLSSVSSVNANASLDYPDIPASAIAHTLITSVGGSNLNTSSGTAKLDKQTGAVVGGEYTDTDYIKVAVSVPQHQPANLQIWDSTTRSPGIPTALLLGSSSVLFPHGYIEGSGTGAGNSIGGGTPQHVFVDLSGRGQYNPIYPYRDVQSFAGVPVNMKTTTQTATVSLENAPSALGIQTENAAPAFNLGFFSPYALSYQSFFKPVAAYNDGNTNLLNVHFGQQMSSTSAGNQPGNQTLYAYSDGNSLLSALGGFDFNGTSGPVDTTNYQRTTMAGAAQNLTGTSIPEQSFLFRTSLDTDLMRAYGRNPQLVANYGALYPMGTFHKPRAGSAQPATLTVPDVPESGDPVYSTLPSAVVPTLNPNGTIAATSAPYVGIALPFGTPVGTYKTRNLAPLRLFEGYDPPLTPAQLAAQPYLPPTYGSTVGGHIAPSVALTNVLPLGANNQALVPVSSDGLDLQINVLEDRLTDGYTRGALPMVDGIQAGLTVATTGNPSVAISTPDFAPAAFRDSALGSMSVYWTSARSGSGYSIYGANVPYANGGSFNNYFFPGNTTPPSAANPTLSWWNPIAVGVVTGATNSGLSIASGPTAGYGPHIAFDVAVKNTTPYSNTLYSYQVDSVKGTLSNAQPVTPLSDSSQVKYGVKGLLTGNSFTNNVWAFWTASTRGRTALYYSPQSAWNSTPPPLLPIPAGLTAVSDASPLLMPYAPVNGKFGSVIEVTYSGTGPDGNADLYTSRYVPHGTTATTAGQLDLVPFPAVTENLRAANGWYQGRDVAWSRTGALNLSVPVTSSGSATAPQPLLYSAAGKPLFGKAIYDKASGFLVLTGVQVPYVTPPAAPAQQYTVNTVTVDAATGRVRFSPALLLTQAFAAVQATFSPLARRLTTDSRADVAPVTFLDTAQKMNDGPGFDTTGKPVFPDVAADRRWTIWRKAGTAGTTGSATLYYKTQRLTLFLPNAIGLSNPATPATPSPLLTSVMVGSTDVTAKVDVDYARGRIYFPTLLKAEGQSVNVTYTAPGATSTTTVTDIVQWQDEFLANDTTDAPPSSTAAGLDTIVDNKVAITTATNENNPAAFLDPLAGLNSPHKVWLFWNSTRNGTADIYSETIDPQFEPRPTP